MKVCSNGTGLMTKMSTRPIYNKKPFKNLFLQNQKANDLGTWYVALGMWWPTKFVQMTYLLPNTRLFMSHWEYIFVSMLLVSGSFISLEDFLFNHQ